MSKFIVVKVISSDYDHVDSLKSVCSFGTKKEAKNYIQVHKDKIRESWNQKAKYISDYIDNLEEFKIEDEAELRQHLEVNYGFQVSNQFSKEIVLGRLKQSVLDGYYCRDHWENFDPPKVKHEPRLFVLEVKDE